jgi:hypothetical protein
MSLHPDHKSDLQNSGLSGGMIEAAGIYSVPPGQINKILGWDASVDSMMAFPYPGTEGTRKAKTFHDDGKFIRYKVFPPRLLKTGKTQKYYQERLTGNHVYQTPGFNSEADVIHIVEGEKKSLKGAQEGLNCLGLSGLWGWKKKGEEELIEDFNKYKFEGKQVSLIPDNDWRDEDKNLEQAVNRLGRLLEKRGADVKIVLLPEGQDHE